MDDVCVRMDRMYRLQRFIYDPTRKYYLLGRDAALRAISPQPGERLCEVGCGTARNLVLLARRWPALELYGVDASAEMLRSARATLARTGLAERVRLGLGTAQAFEPGQLFGLEQPFDHVLFSYSLSMMDDWQPAIEHARGLLGLGGCLHVVDFGGQQDLPAWFSRLLSAWLALFDVHIRPQIPAYLGRQPGRLHLRSLFRGYAYHATLRRTGGALT